MSRPWKARTAVYVVITESGFIAPRPWAIPNGFTEGSLYAKNLSTREAKEFVRVFNARAMKAREQRPSGWDHKWAISVPCVRRNWHASRVEGGAA